MAIKNFTSAAGLITLTAVTQAPFQLRRATLDDLPALRELWREQGRSHQELEKRFTDFQVAADAAGLIQACLGFQTDGHQACLYGETFRAPELEPELRPPLWQRTLTLAKNHAIHRVWIQAENPFWRAAGFQEPDDKQKQKLPERFGVKEAGWLLLPLREEISPEIFLEHEFERFKQSQRDQSERSLRHMRVLRWVTLAIALIGLGLVLAALWELLRRFGAPATQLAP